MKLLGLLILAAPAAAAIDFSLSYRTPPIDGDKAAVLHSLTESPLLVGNDGGAPSGGLRAWPLTAPQLQRWDSRTGRTKLVGTLHGRGQDAQIVTHSQEDSVFRVFNANGGVVASRKYFGDYSALCTWGLYVYMFEKRRVMMLMVQGAEITEVRWTPVDAE